MEHWAFLVADLERSEAFYEGILGMERNDLRPNDKLPFPGTWYWIGGQSVHLMELPNPDPMGGRAEHGGRCASLPRAARPPPPPLAPGAPRAGLRGRRVPGG